MVVIGTKGVILMSENITILVADDEDRIRRLLKMYLEREGYEVDEAENGAEALEKAVEKDYHAIILDVMMPEKDGFEFLKMLREQNNKIPFIVFTVTEDKETALKAFTLGANGFVGKYGDPETVFATLRRCIEKSVNTR